jgi:hypothetical protein
MADLCEQIRDNDRFARAGHWETLSFVERQRNSRCLTSPVKAIRVRVRKSRQLLSCTEPESLFQPDKQSWRWFYDGCLMTPSANRSTFCSKVRADPLSEPLESCRHPILSRRPTNRE